jgi:hypothetical protein
MRRLRRRWRMVFGRAAPEQLPRSLLQRALAYRIQVDALGDLDRDTIRMLDRLARGGRDGAVIPLPELRGTKPGTLLVREWEGTLQRVMVLEQGFAWNGQTYESLSKVARAITGTNWNGPRFFGLRETSGGVGRRLALTDGGCGAAEPQPASLFALRLT